MDNIKLNIRVWDFPIRFFHWSMVGLLAGLWWTASMGEMQWHQLLGYVLLNLILCRFIWGWIGSDTARFSFFLVSPKKVLQHLQPKKREVPSLGHNPIGGYMVILLLLLLSIQLISGLFATDDIFTEGPLFHYVSSDTAAWFTWLHKNTFNVILTFAGVHILAVFVHLFKGDNLITAMVTGKKRMANNKGLQLRFTHAFVALGLFLVIGSVIFYFWGWPVFSML
ncbi:cytochrome b/b6 domain-containing protein [uncultured Shewanella sp.]|uniref:cytochrome b/b6 domain-containing protein n=1 Tax=uncultured Shewanella sp. TaxID=173975 RepID=UPI002621CB45|nr:cytochrome b/b6 domain-containing protein [uncultured Shewanella sp.]